MSQTSGQILKVEGVSKRFGGVQALNNVDFDLTMARCMPWWVKTGRANPL